MAQQWIVKRSGAGGTGVLHRTLLVKDATVGNDIADHVTAYAGGNATRLVGVLRKVITADLVVRVKKNGTEFVTITVPAATAVDEPVEQTTFADGSAVADGDVFSWDITSSDGQKDAAGVASFTLEWMCGKI